VRTSIRPPFAPGSSRQTGNPAIAVASNARRDALRSRPFRQRRETAPSAFEQLAALSNRYGVALVCPRFLPGAGPPLFRDPTSGRKARGPMRPQGSFSCRKENWLSPRPPHERPGRDSRRRVQLVENLHRGAKKKIRAGRQAIYKGRVTRRAPRYAGRAVC